MIIFGAAREDNGIKGYTLIDMMLIIVISGILLLVANSMFTNFGKNTNLHEAAGALTGDIKLAKQRSVAENVNYSIILDINSNSYTMNKYDSNGNMITTPIKTIKLSNFGNGISIKSSNNTITFLPRGTCNVSGTITLQNSLKSEIDIIASPMGRIRNAYRIKYL